MTTTEARKLWIDLSGVLLAAGVPERIARHFAWELCARMRPDEAPGVWLTFVRGGRA
jgi:hypothetical protein